VFDFTFHLGAQALVPLIPISLSNPLRAGVPISVRLFAFVLFWWIMGKLTATMTDWIPYYAIRNIFADNLLKNMFHVKQFKKIKKYTSKINGFVI